jgi:DNA-binding CsgD family transcriptional regulator
MLIGRTRETAVLQAALERATGKAGAVVLISGEAGVGKTHLVGALAHLAQERGCGVRIGRCFADATQGAFAPWREALGEAFVSGTRPGRARLGARDDRARSFEAVLVEIAARAAAAPQVIVIEDLQWGDRDTLSLFLHVARFGLSQALLLLGTIRSPDLDTAQNQPLDDLLAELARESRCTLMSLRPFAREEVADCAAAIAGAAVPQAIVAAVHAETGGNALYVRELVRHLLEEGKIALRDGRIASDFSTAELGLPPSVRHLVRQRVARLPASVAAMLRAAALISGSFRLATLLRATAGAAEAIPAQSLGLEPALSAGLVRVSGERYELSHAIVGRALAEELTPERRTQLHREIALALQVTEPAMHAEIAAHHHAARDLPGSAQGVAPARAAAESARATGAYERAAAFLAMAVDLAGPLGPGEVAETLCQLAVVRGAALDERGAQAEVERAIAALLTTGQERRVPDLLMTVARELAQGGASRSSWEPMLTRARGALGAQSNRGNATWAQVELLGRALVPIISGPVFVSRYGPADPEAVQLLRATGAESDFAATIDPHDSRTPEETAGLLALTASWREPAAILRVRDVCARDRFFRDGDFHATIALSEQQLALAQRVESLGGEVAAQVILGCCWAVTGEIDRARAAALRSTDLANRLGSLHRLNLVGPLAVATAIGYLTGADWGRITAPLVDFATSPRAAGTPFGFVALNLALVAASSAGDRDTVLRLLPEHLRALAALPVDLNEWAAGRDCGATAVWQLEAAEHAAAYLNLAQRGLDEDACACWSNAAASAARMAALLGDRARATALFARARRNFERTGRQPLLPITDLDEARALIRNGAGADPRVLGLLQGAEAGFRRFGMLPWIAAVDGVRAQLAVVSAALPAAFPDGLSAREGEVLRLIAQGLANKEIAAALFISVPTVERHVANIYGKIGTRSRAAAAGYALRKGLAPR